VSWIQAARSLAVQFNEVAAQQEKEEKDAADAKAISETELQTKPA
jgi:DNA-binding Xre family transcriptional regulator